MEGPLGTVQLSIEEAYGLLAGRENAVIVTDEDGVIDRWSRAATTILGWPPETALGRNFAELAGRPEDGTVIAMAITTAADGRIRLGMRPSRRPDGTVVGLFGFACPVEEDGRRLLVGVLSPADADAVVEPTEVPEEDRPRWRALAERAMARVALEEAEVELARLTEFSRALSRVSDLDAVISRVAQAAATAAGTERVAVYLRSDIDPDRLVLAASTGIPGHQLRQFRQRDLEDAQSANAIAVRTGRPLWVESPEEKERMFPVLAGRGDTLQALAVLPLVAEDHPLGSIAVSYDYPRRFRAADRLFLTGLADLAAQAVARAQMRAREKDLVATLQRAVLPVELPTVPGIDLAARYLPADDAAGVGGDWWDAFVLPNGRLGLAVGDVAGHGLPAAGAMAKLRNGLRAYLYAGYEPGDALGLAEAFLGASGRDVATAAAGVLDPERGRLVWAAAGHLPPLRVHGTSAEYLLMDEPDPLIGVGGGQARATRTTQLEPGTTLTLFTDGLVESRRRDVEAGLVLLREVARQIPIEDPATFCDELVERLAPTGDDVCLLVIRYRAD